MQIIYLQNLVPSRNMISSNIKTDLLIILDFVRHYKTCKDDI